ncbi:MAG TPA: uracil-DNA glycosylase family protein [Burkholderiaceae bacterium]|jgi:uracil-DNA glycosylase|nr:uracil-DNA glycosylase family protein [Burkholderiaceae bacterium]
MTFPPAVKQALFKADPSWQPVLREALAALHAVDATYLHGLIDAHFLPTEHRLFAAFAQPLDHVRYVLVGEGPYPRADSATGVCFMDGAVGSLWSEAGLSKQVNRATSLRNFMKLLLVADGKLDVAHTSGAALAPIAQQARTAGSQTIQTLMELQDNLTRHGFLLLNASLVFRPDVPPVKDAKAWRPFLQTVLGALALRDTPPTLVLWGKIAEQLQTLPLVERFPKAVSEHPYNLSFIGNTGMQKLFGPMQLLQQSLQP